MKWKTDHVSPAMKSASRTNPTNPHNAHSQKFLVFFSLFSRHYRQILPGNEQHHDGDVILAVARTGQVHQGLRGRLEVQPAHRRFDFGIFHHISQAVGAEQEQVAGEQAQSLMGTRLGIALVLGQPHAKYLPGEFWRNRDSAG